MSIWEAKGLAANGNSKGNQAHQEPQPRAAPSEQRPSQSAAARGRGHAESSPKCRGGDVIRDSYTYLEGRVPFWERAACIALRVTLWNARAVANFRPASRFPGTGTDALRYVQLVCPVGCSREAALSAHSVWIKSEFLFSQKHVYSKVVQALQKRGYEIHGLYVIGSHSYSHLCVPSISTQ